MDIKEALGQLDTLDDSHWTAEDAPRVDVVSDLVGHNVTRQEIIDAAPTFSRKNTDLISDAIPANKTILADDTNEDDEEDMFYLSHEEFTALMQPALESDSVEDLRKRFHKLERVESKLNDQQKELTKMIRDVQSARDRLQEHLDVVDPNTSNDEAIRDYIRSQHEQRAARVNRRSAILQDLTESDLKTKSPLDEAMARKNTRGTARPKR